ncbi:MAG: TetR/AcrR family transcriptional regulator, partial [Phaeodactylibacter sp.]|nr:TetR/AcrR family transcriptional regulator [Phaeodactylibacter sp.]
MPKQTFLNLAPEKRKRITNAFLREFAIKSFDEASITVVVKELGIAKGSVYQYFEDKQDLFLYLLGVCTEVKLGYVQSIRRPDYPDFWAYFRDLYEHGYHFDLENPLESHFLHNLTQTLNSPSIPHLYDALMQQSIKAFEGMAAYEVGQGLFRTDISPAILGYMLYKVG